ncbi:MULTISPECIES: spermidine synthase [Corynebacterium]|uniref:Methyltransferase domain n=1 Tax=Corynebacterium singulare TaxID=161899 RepID=A0A0B6EV73_9CORY|nr:MULTISPECIES: fused MFS/spermidine synthase [Corynebacterium]AJI78733.1 Methyltransferase domain [Corynebacterium singulare]MCQ9677172.1 fused MFS/spermidine synthase [Corynebacterium sp. BF-R-2]OFT62851.1 spermidine synthase [Corynebacterium sp. HMSC05E07]
MGRKRNTEESIAGTYEISTGELVVKPDPFRDGAYILNINGVPSSHLVPDEPRALEFEYMRWIAAAVEHLAPGKRLLHLGGGGCSLPRYFADLWPDSHNTVVELDAKLAELIRELADIPSAPRVKIRAGEARAVTEGFPTHRFDVIIRDVFAGAVTPESLTTKEFFQHAHATLSSGGLYVANCGDYPDLQGAKAELAGMAEVFEHVAVIADPPMLKGRRYGNIILIGSDTELPTDGSPAAATISKPLLRGAVPAHYRDEAWTRHFFSGASPRRDTPAL